MKERVLITGAGSAAGVSLIQRLLSLDYDVFAADTDPWASGLMLVPSSRRVPVVRGGDPDFATDLVEICATLAIDVLIPTVDVELLPLARRRQELERNGVRVAVAGVDSLARVLDRWALYLALRGRAYVPLTVLGSQDPIAAGLSFPMVVRPRWGSARHPVRVVNRPPDLHRDRLDDSWIIQAYLTGQEYSVDVLQEPGGRLLSAVPQVRARVRSGVAVAARTVRSHELTDAAGHITSLLGLSLVSNVQLRRDADGVPRLLEVTPRFPASMPITVRAGIDMPHLVVGMLLGAPPPAVMPLFEEVGMVRTWEEHFFPLARDDEERAAIVADAAVAAAV